MAPVAAPPCASAGWIARCARRARCVAAPYKERVRVRVRVRVRMRVRMRVRVRVRDRARARAS